MLTGPPTGTVGDIMNKSTGRNPLSTHSVPELYPVLTDLYRNVFAVCSLVSVVCLTLQPTHVHAQNERNLKCGFSLLTCPVGHQLCPVVE